MSDDVSVQMFQTSNETDKLDAALAKAQAAIKGAVKDAVNPFFKSKYADLSSVWEACNAALTANGISVTQWPVHASDGRLHIITRLACAGQWMRGEFSLPVSKQDAQGYVASATYGRRCALAAAVGVCPEDDDGETSVARPAKQQPAKQQAKPENGQPKAEDLHGRATAILRAALKDGVAGLELAWKTLSREMTAVVTPDERARLREEAEMHPAPA